MKKILIIFLLSPLLCVAQTITTVVGTGVAGFGGDGGPATAAQLQSPSAIAFDKSGNMYVVDGGMYGGNYKVRKINTLGIISTVAGNGVRGSSGDNGPATAAEIWPTSIATDTLGNIYIAETKRIRKINTAGIITTIAGNDTFGYNGDGIPATAAKLSYPYLGFIDTSGALYFSDQYNHRIRKIDAAGIISTVAGTGANGSSGDGDPATDATMGTPGFLSGNLNGDIFIPDNGGRRVRKVFASGTITAFAGTGAGGDGGDGGPATTAALGSAENVACDDAGNAYISVGSINTIRKVDTAGIITTVAGSRTAGYSGDGGPATAARFNSVAFVAMHNGNLFVADMYNNCIRRIGYNTTSTTDVPFAANNIAIYPNPAINEITIRADKAIEKTAVMNIAGQMVMMAPQASSKAKEARFDISQLPQGVYVVMVNNVYVGRLVKE